ncbi:MAG: family protein CutC [Actinomycetota bacterium]|nr:family protein CutC [Actinomycetota bacterium]
MELEVIAFDLESCLVAQTHGADRIELCANPHEGGTTPSYGMIALARRSTSVQLFPIIRPRGGDFLYSELEFQAMVADVKQCQELRCDGVVFGILARDGSVDVDRCAELIVHAGAMQTTFHRAFDRVRDPLTALEDIIGLGFSRVLTSGLQPDADRGKEMLRTLVQEAQNRIGVMPGSGVRSTNILELARFTGARAFHSSARRIRASGMEFVNPAMAETLETVSISSAEVAELRRLLDIYAKENREKPAGAPAGWCP